MFSCARVMCVIVDLRGHISVVYLLANAAVSAFHGHMLNSLFLLIFCVIR